VGLWLCGHGLCFVGSHYLLSSYVVGYALLVSVLLLGYGARPPLQRSVVGIHPTLSLLFIMGFWLLCLTNSLFVCVGTQPSSWWLQGFGICGKCCGLRPSGLAL